MILVTKRRLSDKIYERRTITMDAIIDAIKDILTAVLNYVKKVALELFSEESGYVVPEEVADPI